MIFLVCEVDYSLLVLIECPVVMPQVARVLVVVMRQQRQNRMES